MRLPWHDESRRQFISRAEAGNLPHALLISGDTGIGKLAFASEAAAALLCQATTSDAACGECKSCHLLLAGTHPDLASIEPAEPGKQIKVDEIRALGEFVEKTPQISRYKVAIIHPAEKMNTAAANSLLKNLEEPPGETYLLLVSSSPATLLATIRSRCQLVSLQTPSRAESANWLREQRADVDFEVLLDIAENRPLLALGYAESDIPAIRDQIRSDLLTLTKGASAVVSVAEKWRNHDPNQTLLWLQSWLQDGIRLYATDNTEFLRVPADSEWLRAALQGASSAELQGLLQDVTDARRIVLSGTNPNWQMLIEEVLLRWATAIHPRGRLSGSLSEFPVGINDTL